MTLLVFAAMSSAGCGGAGTFPAGSVVNSPGGGGTPQPPPNLVDVKVTVTIPGKRHALNPEYVSPNTQSIVIQLYSVDGEPVGGVNPKTINTVGRARGCKTDGSQTVCMGTALGSSGSDVFSVTTYAGTNATGAVLSVGSVEATIHGGNSPVQVNNLSLTLYGVIASLKLSLSPNGGKRGHPVTSHVTLSAYDATGAQIIGPSDYEEPVVLGIQGDNTHAFHLHLGKLSGSSLTIRKPSSGISLAYDGNKNASSISLAANLDGYGSVGANANFKLHGKQPPPPVGTIYVLNLGSKGGQSATVTEYDGKANGNAPPKRSLTLDSKLYARSIAVDSTGNLYVGYIDNTLGYNPANGSPDAGNEVAIYAPDASGSEHPTALVTSTANSALFPIYLNVDPSGRLVTYGSTNVDSNTGDAVLTYAAGASGSVDPIYAFDFASPGLYYPGPTGLAIDSNNNFYVNGALHSILGNQYGLYVVSAGDIGNPKASAARTIQWIPSVTQLAPGFTSNVSLDSSGEIFIGVWIPQGSGSTKICQAAVNVYSAGTSGGITNSPPLRVLTLGTVETQGNGCYSSGNPLLPYFPTIQLYGTSLFAVDDFNNAVVAFAAGGK
ncbi:MAG TPA: hypothetical protein VGG70_11310, partial [Candidatus Cybelea sp.]